MAQSERWEGSEVGIWERWRVVRWQGRKDGSSEVARWEIPCFIQGWGMQDETKISSICF